MAVINSDKHLVTCIIPTKNRPEFIVSAVKSVLNQTYKNIELIIIDDSDNNKTEKVLMPFEGKVKYIKNKISRGSNYSRNTGLCNARGKYISFLDDDDIWFPQKTEVQLQLLRYSSLVGCNYISLADNKKQYIQLPREINYENMLYFNYLGSCSFVMVNSKIIKNCFFDETLTSAQDWDMWLSLMKKNNIKKIVNAGQYLVHYNKGRHLRISNNENMSYNLLAIYKKYNVELDTHNTQLFYLYNMFPASSSPILKLFKEFLKLKLLHKNIFTLFKIILKRFFNRIEIY